MTVLVKKCVAVSGVNFRVRPMPISRVEVKTCRQGDTLLQKMTPEQRSLVLDDFDETPLMYRKVLAVVESQEVTT